MYPLDVRAHGTMTSHTQFLTETFFFTAEDQKQLKCPSQGTG